MHQTNSRIEGVRIFFSSPQYCVSGLRLISIFSLKSLRGIYPPALLSLRIDLFETSTRCKPLFLFWKYISAAQHTDNIWCYLTTPQRKNSSTLNATFFSTREYQRPHSFQTTSSFNLSLTPFLTQDTHITRTSTKMTKTSPTAAKTIGLCIASYGFFAALIVVWRQYAFFYLSAPTREMFVNYGH